MTRIDFYVLPDTRAEGRMILACKIAEKAYTREHKIFVNSASAAEAKRLDELMWTFRDGSFLPHMVVDTKTDVETAKRHPIHIAHGAEPGRECDLLINLAHDVPTYFSRFERVAEVVNSNADCRQSGRERFRFYRDRGYDLKTHKLSG